MEFKQAKKQAQEIIEEYELDKYLGDDDKNQIFMRIAQAIIKAWDRGYEEAEQRFL